MPSAGDLLVLLGFFTFYVFLGVGILLIVLLVVYLAEKLNAKQR